MSRSVFKLSTFVIQTRSVSSQLSRWCICSMCLPFWQDAGWRAAVQKVCGGYSPCRNQHSCCFLQSFWTNCEANPPLYSVGTAGSLNGAKRPRREFGYSRNLMLRFSSAPSHTLWRTVTNLLLLYAFLASQHMKNLLCLQLTWIKRTFSATFSPCHSTSISTFLMTESNAQDFHKSNLPLVW